MYSLQVAGQEESGRRVCGEDEGGVFFVFYMSGPTPSFVNISTQLKTKMHAYVMHLHASVTVVRLFHASVIHLLAQL